MKITIQRKKTIFMPGECIKIARKLVKNGNNRYTNKIFLQGKIELIIAILGKPHNQVVKDGWIYYWKDREVKLWWKGFGFFELTSDERGVTWFLECLIAQSKTYNDFIKFTLYQCKNDLEWAIVRKLIGENRLLVYLDSIKLVNYTASNRKADYWHF